MPDDVPGIFLPDKLWALVSAEDTNPRWLACVLADPAFRPLLAGVSNGTSGSMKNISQDSFMRLPIVIPPRHEQDRIVEILQTWERGIALANALRTTVSKALTGYLHQQLGLGVDVSAQKQWRSMTLGTVGRVVAGGTPSTSAPGLWGGGIAWITPAEITKLSTRYANTTERTLTDTGLRASAAEVVPAGSLIVCTRASVGEMAINTVPMATNQGFKSVVPHASVFVEFLYYYLRANSHALVRLAAGSTFSEVSKTAFESIPVALPGIEQQRRIAGLLGALDDEIALLGALITQLQRQRHCLMSKLLSGGITASAPECKVAEPAHA